MHTQNIVTGLCALSVIWILLFLYTSLTSPLRSVPGPLWARFNRLWFFNRVRQGHFEHDNIALHRRHGPVVRVAPDMYSIDSPEVVNKVYAIGSKFPKADWYEGWKAPDPHRWALFPDRDMKRHADTRRKFQGLYSMTSLVSYEAYVDECAVIFDKRLTEFAERGEAINMTHWFQCYAFDVIGDITYSRRFGFLDRGEDVSGLLKALDSSMIYSTLIGIYPAFHWCCFTVMTWLGVGGAAARSFLMKFVEERISERKAKKAKDVEKSGRRDENGPQDFLEKLMVQNEENPSKVTAYHVFMMGLSNIIAGSDTTAVSLSSVLYNLIRNPNAMKKLRAEIEQFESDGRCGKQDVRFRQSQDMPYLQAVIKEALRLHPATGLPLWRVVPEGGVEICHRFFPAGTIVGLNTWCAHYNEDVFGKDAKDFRPERWLEADREGGEKARSMDAYYMPFGLGSRTCLGRHISLLEMSKLIPQLVRRFDFELDPPGREWSTENYWFVKPSRFWVKVKLRQT